MHHTQRGTARVDKNRLLDGGPGGGESEASPHRPLLGPDRALQHLAQVALGDGLGAGREAEGQDVSLNVGGQEQKVHHLGQAGAGDAVVAGDAGGMGLAQSGLAAGASD